jgi:hypothetical protein
VLAAQMPGWRLADGPRRRCDSHSRVAVVSAG